MLEAKLVDDADVSACFKAGLRFDLACSLATSGGGVCLDGCSGLTCCGFGLFAFEAC